MSGKFVTLETTTGLAVAVNTDHIVFVGNMPGGGCVVRYAAGEGVERFKQTLAEVLEAIEKANM